MTDWKKVTGSQAEKPQEFDTATSAVVVYQRRNIKRITVQNTDGQETELWEYDERELTREEYARIRVEAQQEQIEQIDETSTTGLLAVTDLYEQLIEKGVL